MTEPNRWRQDGAPEEVARLLEAARREQPAPAGLQRTLVGLGVSAGAAGVAGKAAALAAGATSGKAALISAAKWGAVGLAATLSVVTATTVVRRSETRARPAASTQVAEPRQQVVNQPAMVAPPLEQAAELKEKPRPASPRVARAPEPVPDDAIDAEHLAEQVRIIDRARAALAQNRPGETLAVLNDYEARFSERRFTPEALYLRMEALLATAQEDAARDVANRLLAAAPKGPHSARARLVLEQTNP